MSLLGAERAPCPPVSPSCLWGLTHGPDSLPETRRADKGCRVMCWLHSALSGLLHVGTEQSSWGSHVSIGTVVLLA